ncbi:hypothetical protein H0H92_010629 [Tricholoma furcatifolium]|nr:hypothetical protein H0H92_010629 [Tricholoma furcatifolium]
MATKTTSALNVIVRLGLEDGINTTTHVYRVPQNILFRNEADAKEPLHLHIALGCAIHGNEPQVAFTLNPLERNRLVDRGLSSNEKQPEESLSSKASSQDQESVQ